MTIKGKLIAKNYDWYFIFEDGTERKIYWKKFFNSSDWVLSYKGKKYFVMLDIKNMTAEFNTESEYL